MKRFWPLLLAAFCACAEADVRTQITFLLTAPEASLAARITNLEVTIVSDRPPERPTRTFPSPLRWPVEIVVVPQGTNRTNRNVSLAAIAYDANRRVVAQWNAQAQFASREVVQEAVAPRTGDLPAPGADGGVDAGVDAAMGAGDAARDASPIDATSETDARGSDMEASVEPDSSTATDASSGPTNCMTPGANIACSDNNACNGTERCEPTNASADEKGCVQGTDVVQCATGSTCDRATGRCSTCLVKPDGDGDSVNSIACGGTDCDDSDDSVAPGKPEICDGKDNDCNNSVDGMPASAACTPPTGGTAACEMSRCVQRCNDPNQQVDNNQCVAPIGTCPIVNPCAPGSCVPARGGYTCRCPAGYSAGLTRCAPSGLKRRIIGFDQACDGMATPSTFVLGTKTVPSTLYMSCGIASLNATGLTGQVQLYDAPAMSVEGATGPVLEGTHAAMGSPSEVTISFSPGVNEVSFDALDIDNNMGIRALLESADGLDLLDVSPMPAMGSKRVRVTHTSTTPIARISVSYRPAGPEDRWFLEDLTFDLWGCGDGEREMGASEMCDDGNTVQCDGCDNACVPSPTSGC